eukprot:GGOE01055067.1.p1 GENE.GGOE01055067.1~~GGOE01055067.1.p1  ORF type:complete len:574 (-),score=96.27 GGOE01055067.1:448-2142(-)
MSAAGLLDSDADSPSEEGPQSAGSCRRCNDRDPITCERIDLARCVSIKSPDGTVELRYNTQTLRHIAEVKGQWLQPPHFRSPMDDELRIRVEAIEGPLPPMEVCPSDSEDDDEGEDQFASATDAFQSLLDFFNRRSRLERRDIYICPRCYDAAARTIYWPPRARHAPEPACHASNSSGQAAEIVPSAQHCEDDDDEEEEEEEEEEAESSEEEGGSDETSTGSSSTNTDSSSTDSASVLSQDEWQHSARLLFNERLKFSAASNVLAREQARSSGPDPRTFNPLKVLRALDGDQLHYCAFITARQWKAHLERFHRDTSMLSREDHGLRQYIHAHVARNPRSMSTIHKFWRRHFGYYAWLFNCIYDTVSEEGPEGALVNEEEAEGSSDSGEGEDDWLVADDYVSSSSSSDHQRSAQPPERHGGAGRKRKSDALKSNERTARRRLRKAAHASSDDEALSWCDAPPAALPAGAAIPDARQQPLRQCRRRMPPAEAPATHRRRSEAKPRCVLSQSDSEQGLASAVAPHPTQAACPAAGAPSADTGAAIRRGRLRRNAPPSPIPDNELCLG